jgi:hypothetical protein
VRCLLTDSFPCGTIRTTSAIYGHCTHIPFPCGIMTSAIYGHCTHIPFPCGIMTSAIYGHCTHTPFPYGIIEGTSAIYGHCTHIPFPYGIIKGTSAIYGHCTHIPFPCGIIEETCPAQDPSFPLKSCFFNTFSTGALPLEPLLQPRFWFWFWFFALDIFRIDSCKLFARAGFEPQSS